MPKKAAVSNSAPEPSHHQPGSPAQSAPSLANPYHRRLTEAELATYLSVKTQWLRLWRRKGLLPFLKVGRVVRYRLADVEKALARYEIKAVGEK